MVTKMGENLSANQKRALAALIEHKTVTAAAEAVGLTRKTIYQYLQDPAFRAALTNAERGLIDGAGVRLLAGQEQALDTLEALMGDRDATNRRLAAVAWLNYALKWRELRNIEDRLGELEKAVFDDHK